MSHTQTHTHTKYFVHYFNICCSRKQTKLWQIFSQKWIFLSVIRTWSFCYSSQVCK